MKNKAAFLTAYLSTHRQLRQLKNKISLFITFALLLISFESVAQSLIPIKGTVLMSTDKETVIGANIVLEGTTTGTITDFDGNFSLDVPSNGIINISYVGCKSQKIKIEGKKVFTILLEDESIGLEDFVVVGYGSQRKSDLTGGIVSVGAEELQMVSSNNLMDKLAGQVPGLSITTNKSRPGEDQKIRVRGENSLSANNSPLVVLDGIPYSGSLNDIDPDVIESFSVLKDASSAAIYGSRGANGVILITTKKGKSGTPIVTYKAQVGLQEAESRLDMMKGAEYIQYIQDYNALKFGHSGDALNPENILNPSERENYKNGIETDWQDVMFRTALTHNHQFGISGGTENTTYMASMAHLSQDGIMENTGMKRTNISLNINQVFNKWLTVGMGTQAIQKETGGIQPYLEGGLKQSPYGQIRDDKGNYNPYPMDQTLFYNPMADVDAVNDKTSRNVFISAFADIKLPVDGLSFRTNFGYNYRSLNEGTYYGRNTLTGSKVNGSATIENQHYYDYTWENILKYVKTIGKHKIDGMALFSMQQTNTRKSKQSGESFVNDDSEYHNMAGAENNKEFSSELTETAMLSYMGRINYSYANKYMVTLTARSDGYSAFGANNKYAFFPSVAGAWIISSEEFFAPAADVIDFLKLRASYGSNGNQAINAYQTLDRLKLDNYLWGDGGTAVNGSYLAFNGVGNPNLRWETTNSLNIGVDFSFLSSRLSGNLEFYRSTTNDLLMSRTVPVMNGFKSILYNVGKTQNTGVELNLNSVNIENDNFRWTTSYNFSLNRDKIKELRGDGKDDLANKWFIDEPLRVFYDYNVIGTWQEGDDFEAVVQKGAVPGSAKLEDINGDGKITADDKMIIGSKLPSFLMSMGNQFAYKDFTFSFLLNGVFGTTKEMSYKNFDRWIPLFNYVSGTNYWTPTNPTNEMTSPTYIPYDKHTFYDKVNYVTLKNITLGYNIPKTAINKIGITGLNLNLSVNNVCNISNVDGLNLDADNIAITYPMARSYMFGLNLTF